MRRWIASEQPPGVFVDEKSVAEQLVAAGDDDAVRLLPGTMVEVLSERCLLCGERWANAKPSAAEQNSAAAKQVVDFGFRCPCPSSTTAANAGTLPNPTFGDRAGLPLPATSMPASVSNGHAVGLITTAWIDGSFDVVVINEAVHRTASTKSVDFRDTYKRISRQRLRLVSQVGKEDLERAYEKVFALQHPEVCSAAVGTVRHCLD